MDNANPNSKIIIAIHCFDSSGTVRRAFNMANQLTTKGFSVEIMASHGILKAPLFGFNNGVKIVSVNENKRTFTEFDAAQFSKYVSNGDASSKNIYSVSDSSVDKKPNLLTELYSFITKFTYLPYKANFKRYHHIYREYYRCAAPDAVIAFGHRRFERVLAGTKGLNCKLIDSEANSFEALFPKDKRAYRYYSRILSKADCIVVQTQNEKKIFEKEYNNVRVINNSLKEDLPKPYIGTRKKVIVNFCRISPQKNLPLLIKAFSMFHEHYPEYILVIYGITAELEEVLLKEKLINNIYNQGLSNCIKILSAISNIHNNVLDSAMFVSSSNHEGLSNSMLEAMAIGLPCICTDCLGGGTREVMVDHENGLIVPMNDEEAMFHAMKEFADNPELAEKCSKNAIKIREKLSVEKITNQWIEIIENCY